MMEDVAYSPREMLMRLHTPDDSGTPAPRWVMDIRDACQARYDEIKREHGTDVGVRWWLGQCRHCKELREDHLDDKCLFGSTMYQRLPL